MDGLIGFVRRSVCVYVTSRTQSIPHVSVAVEASLTATDVMIGFYRRFSGVPRLNVS
jgi:hypothetical protein